MRRGLALLALLVAVPLAAPAHAHEAGLSRGDYQVTGASVTAELVFARDVLTALVPQSSATDGPPGEFELLAIDAALRRELADALRVTAGAEPCPGVITRLTFVEEDGLKFSARFECPAALAAVTLRWPLLARLGPVHRHLGQLRFTATGPDAPALVEPEPIDFVAHARRSALTIRRPEPPPRAAAPRPSPPVTPARSTAPAWPTGLLITALAALALAALALRVRARRR